MSITFYVTVQEVTASYCVGPILLYIWFMHVCVLSELPKFKAATRCFKMDDNKIHFAGFACGTSKKKKF